MMGKRKLESFFEIIFLANNLMSLNKVKNEPEHILRKEFGQQTSGSPSCSSPFLGSLRGRFSRVFCHQLKKRKTIANVLP